MRPAEHLGRVGGRRTGLTSHQFQPRNIGQEQRVHTGWLESDGSDRVEDAPHTKAGYGGGGRRRALTFVDATAAVSRRRA
jgi:hypothetical protein